MSTTFDVVLQNLSQHPQIEGFLDVTLPWDENAQGIAQAQLTMPSGEKVAAVVTTAQRESEETRIRTASILGVALDTYQIAQCKLEVGDFMPHEHLLLGSGVLAPPVVGSLVIDGVAHTPTMFKVIEAHLGRTVLESVTRVGSLVITWRYTMYSKCTRFPWSVTAVFSDPSISAMRTAPMSVKLKVPNIFATNVIDFAQKGGDYPYYNEGTTHVIYPLIENDWLGFGQMWGWRGDMFLITPTLPKNMASNAAWLQGAVTGVCTNRDGRWGPWGIIPQSHPSMDKPAAAISQWNDHLTRMSWLDGNMWTDPPLCCSPMPGATGDQEDFGATKGTAALHGFPSWIEFAWTSVLWDATGRCAHHREMNGLCIKPEDHPSCVFQNGRPHWNWGVSPDRLKENPIHVSWRANGPKGIEMTGHDDQHWSINNLCALYALTGDRLLLDALRDHTIAYLMEHRVGPPGSHGATRALRTEQAMAWVWYLTGDERILDRFEGLLQNYKDLNDQVLAGQKMVVASTLLPDKRLIDGPEPWWSEENAAMWPAWEMSLSIGMDAMVRVLRMDEREAANEWEITYDGLLKTWIKNGWRKRNGRWWVVKATRWNNGNVLPEEWYDDPTMVGYTTAYDTWVRTAVRLAMIHPDVDVEVIARQIDAQFQGWYLADTSPKDYWDRMPEWLAVAWRSTR